MKVNEIFKSIQGEGRWVGHPVLFIRLSGCNLACSWCDTKYHTEGKQMNIDEVVKAITEHDIKIVVWTGGEPMLQIKEIEQVVNKTKDYKHHVESNGTINTDKYYVFDYICVSPKSHDVAKKAYLNVKIDDVKVVTDLVSEGISMLELTTMIMPLSTGNEQEDREIEQRVWKYCIEHHIKFCLRQHVKVWGLTKRGV